MSHLYALPTPEVLDVAELDRDLNRAIAGWIDSASKLSVERTRTADLKSENRSLRIAVSILLRVVDAERIKSVLWDSEKEAVASVREMLPVHSVPVGRWGH